MINILRGQTKGITLKLRGLVSGDPLDLTGATEIIVSLPLAVAGTFLTKTLTDNEVDLGSDLKLGIVTVTPDLTGVETLTLAIDSAPQKILVEVHKGSDIKFYKADLLQISDP